MTDQWSKRRWLRLVFGFMAVGMVAFVPALVLKNVALMVLSLAFSGLAGLIMFLAIVSGRGTGPSRT